MTVDKKVPKLRFKDANGNDFPDWEERELGSLCNITTGKINASAMVEGGKYRFYTCAKDFYYVDSYEFDTDALIISGNGAYVGYIHHYCGKFNAYQRTYVLDGFSDHILYIKHFLDRYLYKRIYREKNAGNTPYIVMSTLSEMKIYLPCIEEQQKIASFLGAVDKKIEQLKKKRGLLEDYKKGVMQRIFSQELRFKDANGNDYPAWEEKRLGELGETFNGLSGKSKEDFGEGKPYIQYMQIFNSSKIDVSMFGLVAIKEGEKQNKVLKGDVLFTMSSETPTEIGYASVLTKDVGELYLNSFCFGYRPNSLDELHPEFASYLFRSQFFRKDIVKLAQGSTRYNMSKVRLMKIRIMLPVIEEQQKIGNFLSALDDKIALVDTQVEKTQVYKRGLLQQMFV